MTSHPKVILYSTTLHCWEVWQTSRPLGYGSLEACQAAYPDALPVAASQIALAMKDTP